MREQSTVSRSADCDPSEEAEVQAVSFVVRIWKQSEPADPEYRGWVEHVQSGQRTFFLGLDQLSSVIATHVGIPVRWRGSWKNCLTRWWVRATGFFAQGREGTERGERPESTGGE